MTQEDKDLLIKDLCARLPYDVMVDYESRIYILNEIDPACKDIDYITVRIQDVERLMCAENVMIENIKPYLFPLSNMTEEQKKEFISAAGYEANEEDCGRHTETYYYDMVGHEDKLYPNYEAIDWLNKNHFDYRGLIPMRLAIDCTNLNIY